MSLHSPWTMYEVALLIECYVNVNERGADLDTELKTLSVDLRNMAINSGKEIDDVYRNLNGMQWQYQFIKSAFSGLDVGSRRPSQLFSDMVALYKTNKSEYEKVLKTAYYLAGKMITDMDAETVKQRFIGWIKKNKIKKFFVEQCCRCIDSVSEYAVNHSISRISIWEFTDYKEFNKIRIRLSADSIFRGRDRRLFKAFDKVGKFYADFLKEIYSSPFVSNSENIPVYIDGSKVEKNEPFESKELESNRDNVKVHISVDNILDDYSKWLLQVKGVATVTARAYVSSLRGADEYALQHGIILSSLILLEGNDLSGAVKSILSNEDFSSYNALQHNRFSAALKSFLRFKLGADTPRISRRRSKRISENIECTPELKHLLHLKFPYGFRADSIIDMMKLKGYAEQEGVSINDDDEILKREIISGGINSEGKIYFISDEVYDEIVSLVNSIFEEGVTVFYLEIFYYKKHDWFEEHNIPSLDLVRDILAGSDEEIYVSKNFISKGKERINELDAVEREFKRVWGDSLKHTYEELYPLLPYIPEDKIRFYLSRSNSFVWSSAETFVNIERIVIFDEEKKTIYDFVNDKCNSIGYVSISDVPLGGIIENNYEASITAIYESVYRLVLAGDFNLNGKILTKNNTSIDILTIAKAYCASKDKCLFSEVNDYVTSVNGIQDRQAAFEAAYSVLIRVDEELFILDKFVNFSVDAIDSLLEQNIKGDYASVKSIASFIMFPDCNVPWNHYVLESFCYKYSKKFRLVLLNFNDKNVGIIVKKDSTYGYYDILAKVVADSKIELSREFVGQFLWAAGYTSKKSMPALDSVIDKAKSIREAK